MRRTVNVGWSSLRVGLLLIFAIAVLLWASFSGGGTSIFEPKYKFTCYFPNVNGLVAGAPVWMSGVEVGNVVSVKFVDLDPKRRVELVCKAKKSVWDMITSDSRVQLGTIGFLGDKYVEIIPGAIGGTPIEPGSVIPSQEAPGADALFTEGKKAFGQVGAISSEIDTLLSRMNRGEGTLGQIATNDVLYKDLTHLLANLTKLTADLQRNQERLIGSIENMANSIGSLSEKVDSNAGTMGRLVNDPQLYDNLAATSAQLDSIMMKINAAQGSAGMLVNDTALYTEVVTLVARTNNLISDIQANPRKYFKFSVF